MAMADEKCGLSNINYTISHIQKLLDIWLTDVFNVSKYR